MLLCPHLMKAPLFYYTFCATVEQTLCPLSFLFLYLIASNSFILHLISNKILHSANEASCSELSSIFQYSV